MFFFFIRVSEVTRYCDILLRLARLLVRKSRVLPLTGGGSQTMWCLTRRPAVIDWSSTLTLGESERVMYGKEED